MSCVCRRWAVGLGGWEARDAGEWVRLLSALGRAEVGRALEKVFREDVHSALVGRLLLRAAAAEAHPDVGWAALAFGRTDKGKPFLASPAPARLSLNVSHDGQAVLLAASCASTVGVDVMALDRRRTDTDLDSYFRLMARQFSPAENRRFADPASSGRDKLRWFYRFWCLKEAYIKALGEGIHSDLRSLDFGGAAEALPSCSTRLRLGGRERGEWAFQETELGPELPGYVAAVCTPSRAPPHCRAADAPLPFTFLSVDQLLGRSQPLPANHYDPQEEWIKYTAKLVRNP